MIRLVFFLFFFFKLGAHSESSSAEQVINQSSFQILHDEKSYIEKNQLLSGTHWVQKTDHYYLKTPYGDIYSNQGDFFVTYANSQVRVVNHKGLLQVRLRDGQQLEIPPGFEVWFAEVMVDKKNKVGLIQPVDLKKHTQDLGRIWTWDLKLLKETLLSFQSNWGDRPLMASSYYKSLAQRKIASIQRENQRIENLKRLEFSRRAENRKMMFERAFGR